jgi:hypothetical protein
MNSDTVEAFGTYTGKEFAYGEYLFLLRNLAKKVYDIKEEDIKKIENTLGKKPTVEQMIKAIELYKKEFGDNFSDDVFDQLILIMKKSAKVL